MINYERQIVGIAFDMSKSERTWSFYEKLHETCKIVLIPCVKNVIENGSEYNFFVVAQYILLFTQFIHQQIHIY